MFSRRAVRLGLEHPKITSPGVTDEAGIHKPVRLGVDRLDRSVDRIRRLGQAELFIRVQEEQGKQLRLYTRA